MSESTDATAATPSSPADPLAQQTPPAPTTGAPDVPAAASADDAPDVDVRQLLTLMQQQGETIAQLQRDLAARPPVANPSVTISSTAPAGGPTPGAFDHVAPAHAMLSAGADVTAGDVVRFNIAANNGGDPVTGYGVIVDSTDVPDVDDNGKATGGTHTEYVVARLDVLAVRLRAENIVDEQRSRQVQDQLDAANG